MKINTIINGDCLEVLKTLDSKSVNCCVTSPPYFGLRNYGVDGQLGLEPTPEEYVKNMVNVFREVKRVLKDDGTLWLNLGDSYANTKVGNTETKKNPNVVTKSFTKKIPDNLKPKDLVGIPWRVALALQQDGWYLRQDIIWHKPNPMPESVTDRCTKSHEYIFLLSKSQKYYYDACAIKEELKESSVRRNQSGWNGNQDRDYVGGPQNHMSKYLGSKSAKNETHRNKRSVWTVNTKPFKKAHFAVFPEKLIEPCILAGCPKDGIVLDPFIGSGTTGKVARTHHRNFIGIELNKEYIDKIAKERTSLIQPTLLEP